MFTVCPKCALTLAVTAADLRAGQGYVRCGRCANVFNALLGLAEDSGNALDSAGPPMAPAVGPALAAPIATAVAPAYAPADEPTAASLVPAATATSQVAPHAQTPSPAAPVSTAPPSPPAPPALRLIERPPRPPRPTPEPAGSELQLEKYQSTGTFETIVLEGDTFLQTEELVPEEALDSELADVSRRIAAAQDAAAAAGDSAAARRAAAEVPPPTWARKAAPELMALRAAADAVQRESTRQETAASIAGLAAEPVRPRWLLLAGAAGLALLLMLQMINHWRNDLATHGAWFGAMTRMAGLLGEPLQPNWDLGAYDVRQLGAAADTADGRSLRVRLSLANSADHAQGLPLIRLTLLDRYGKPLSSGALQPEQYLPASLRGHHFIEREQHIDTEVSVLDPSQQATSFELDVCLGAPGGGLRCASDAALAAGRS